MNKDQKLLLEKISNLVIEGDQKAIPLLTQQAIANQIKPRDILEYGLIYGMATVGERFRTGEMFIPEVMSASQAMHAGIEVLSPLLADKGKFYAEKIVLGTVRGDMHDIGKTLVKIILEGGGFEVIDLGINVPAEKFIQEIKAHQAQILGLSALLSTSMLEMKKVISELQQARIREQVKVIIGGAPVTQQFAREIGADAYAPDAGGALAEIKRLIGVQEKKREG